MRPTPRRTVLRSLALGSVGGLAGCESPTGGARTATPTQATLQPDGTYGYTHIQPTGNRVIRGTGNVRDADPVTVETADRPAWLVALPAETGSFWTVATTDGAVRTLRVAGGSAETVARYEPLAPGAPPLLRAGGSADATGGAPALVRPPGDAARLTHPVVTAAGTLYVTDAGTVVLDGEDRREAFEVRALPDGRIVRVDDRRYALLGDLTRRYRHGALGDDREGGSLVVVNVVDGRVETRTEVGPPAVVEGIKPIVASFDDGDPVLVVTLARSGEGARIATFRPDGRRVATGPPLGTGGWRHQLCVAPFGTDGERELAVVRKPHVEHSLEFYRPDGSILEIEATLDGFSTHTYGSHNPDGALAADLDDDGAVELLAPRTARDRLLAVRRTDDGAAVAWELDVGGVVRTNVAGTRLPDGRVAVGVGSDAGVRVWQG